MLAFPLIDSILLQSAMAIVLATTVCVALARLRTMFVLEQERQKSVVDEINHLLPQTQCGRCGYEGCRPYAKAISQGESLNRCPPGGPRTIANLASLLNDHARHLSPANGSYQAPSVAVIREQECIGCTKCIQACPVDAIHGAAKLMHTVIALECTGCDLCVEPCPVDCIDMISSDPNTELTWQLPSRVTSVLRPKELSA